MFRCITEFHHNRFWYVMHQPVYLNQIYNTTSLRIRTEIGLPFHEDIAIVWVRNMATDVLVPYFARSSAAMILIL